MYTIYRTPPDASRIQTERQIDFIPNELTTFHSIGCYCSSICRLSVAGKKRIPTFLILHLIECSMNKEMSVYGVTEIILLASSGYVSRVQYILWLTEAVKSRSLQSFTKCWRMKRRFQLSVSFLDYSPSCIAGLSILPSVCFYHYSFVLRPERKKEGRGLRRDEHFLQWSSNSRLYALRIQYSSIRLIPKF